ncbi:MAG: YwaF family protein [Nocardioides sp.]
MDRFEAYTAEHFALIALFVLGAVAVVLIGRSHAGTAREEQFRRGFAVVMLSVNVVGQLMQFTPSEWDRETSLPLHLSDLAWMVGVVALWTRSPRWSTVVYLWGLTMSLQGIVTPSLDETFPEPRYFLFWAMHMLTIWAALYLVAGLRVPPTGYWATLIVTLAWAVAVGTFNQIASTNYGYLDHKPASGSLLDLMGPWPVYLGVATVILMAIWALLVWPWLRHPRPDAQPR